MRQIVLLLLLALGGCASMVYGPAITSEYDRFTKRTVYKSRIVEGAFQGSSRTIQALFYYSCDGKQDCSEATIELALHSDGYWFQGEGLWLIIDESDPIGPFSRIETQYPDPEWFHTQLPRSVVEKMSTAKRVDGRVGAAVWYLKQFWIAAPLQALLGKKE